MESKHICVIGGGLAGHFAALAYNKAFPDYEVTMIYSSEIPIIGVGESGILDLPRFLFLKLDLDINSFYREVNPLHKMGLSFVDWHRKGQIYNYTFDCAVSCDWFLNDLITMPLDRKTLASTMMYYNLSPVQNDGSILLGINSYQLENKKFVAWLEKAARSRGINYVDAEVEGIVFKDASKQEISHLKIKGSDQKHSYDFYAFGDGFNGLINKELKNEFVSFKPWLPCDRAVVGQHELTPEDTKHSYTISWRMSNGWMWQIDCPTRTGKGYVFNSETQSDEQAVEEYIEKNQGRIKDPRVIPFKTGFNKTRFGKNFALIGNCQGFAEPLESTGFTMIITSIDSVINIQKTNGDKLELSPSAISLLSKFNEDVWWEIVDFLTLHYKYNYDWDNTFWNMCNNELKMRDDFVNMLNFFEENSYYNHQTFTPVQQIKYAFFSQNIIFDIPGIVFHLDSKSRIKKKIILSKQEQMLNSFKRASSKFMTDSEVMKQHQNFDFFNMYKNNQKTFTQIMEQGNVDYKF